jgi:hypothetical protein
LPIETALPDGGKIPEYVIISAAVHNLVKIDHIGRTLPGIDRHGVLRVCRVHPANQNTVAVAAIYIFRNYLMKRTGTAFDLSP